MRTAYEVGVLFRSEYERLSRDVFQGRLYPWPGVKFTAALGRLATTRPMRHPLSGQRMLKSFTMSRAFAEQGTDEQILDTIRHEIAHAAEWCLHGTSGHGLVWMNLAVKCGAAPRAKANIPIIAQLIQEKRASRPPVGVLGCENGCFRREVRDQRTKVARDPARFTCRKCKTTIRWIE